MRALLGSTGVPQRRDGALRALTLDASSLFPPSAPALAILRSPPPWVEVKAQLRARAGAGWARRGPRAHIGGRAGRPASVAHAGSWRDATPELLPRLGSQSSYFPIEKVGPQRCPGV